MGERAAVRDIAGYRVITLDSLVPGQVHGWISDTQRLVAGGAGAAVPTGTVVVLHHPPITLDSSYRSRSGSRNASALSEAIEGSDVQVVLCGHFHVQITGRLGSVPVWIGPGVLTRIDLTAPPRLERAVRGAAANVVDVGGSHSQMFHMLHARDSHAGQTVYLLDAMSGEDVDTE